MRRAALCFVLFFLLGVFLTRAIGGLRNPYEFFDPIIDAYQIISRHAVEEPDRDELQAGAIRGMLETLDDRYAEYVPPMDRDEFAKEYEGRYVGIGALVTTERGRLEIASPLEDSPSFKAGLLAGDRVLEIGGVSTENKSVDECIEILKGEPGSKVRLKIERGAEVMEVEVKRERIVVRAVKGLRRAPGEGEWDYWINEAEGIAYVRLTQFLPSAYEELSGALKRLKAAEGGLKGLVLDLRGNPGGDLDPTLEIADLFLKEGVIVSVKGRDGADEIHRAKEAGTLPEFPMVVMVNGSSASASEIVSGALSDHGRAVVVGTRTFGKGLVQRVVPVPSLREAAVKVTAQRYYLPSGRLIQREDDAAVWGVDPSPGFYVDMTIEEEIARFRVLQQLDVIRATDDELASILGEGPLAFDDPAWVREHLKDAQLAAAVEAIRSRLAKGVWTAVSDATEQFAKVNLSEMRALDEERREMLREFAALNRRMTALSEGKAAAEEPDLWPDEVDVSDGRLRVLDKEGNVVAELEITSGDLERWLTIAPLKPVEGKKE